MLTPEIITGATTGRDAITTVSEYIALSHNIAEIATCADMTTSGTTTDATEVMRMAKTGIAAEAAISIDLVDPQVYSS